MDPLSGHSKQLATQQGRSSRIETVAVDPDYFESQRVSFLARGGAGNSGKLGKRKYRGSASDLDNFSGPWAGYEAEPGSDQLSGPTPEEQAQFEYEQAKNALVKASHHADFIQPGEEKSMFHGASEHDYLGRTYMHVPAEADLQRAPPSSRLPKRLIHTWTGHSKGVLSAHFFPSSAHLLLSASMDGKVKVWDVYNQRKCLRTLIGHNKAVKDAIFSYDGRKILTASYDKNLKLWDTETGKCVQRYGTKAIPYCITFNPDRPDSFLSGCSDKRVYQWDLNSGSIVQEYNEHGDAVNTITFIDNNRRIVTTSDDKTIRVWECNVPVSIQTISDLGMYPVTSASLNPDRDHFLAQSMNNQILVYSCSESVKVKNKKFTGHSVAGYACQVSFSPDGQYVASGDGRGKLCFWDWKTGHMIKNVQAHDRATVGCEWNPREASRVVTCSWDGTIKYWD